MNSIKDLQNTNKRAEFVSSIQRKIDISVYNYAKYTDGKIPESERMKCYEKYDQLTDEVAEMLKAIGIKTDWPGLFPVCLMPDGSTEHNIERAVNWIFDKKA